MPTPAGTIRLFQFRGIVVFLHWTWLVVAAYEISGRSGTYSNYIWNVVEYLALFVIVTLHEFGHALACRSVGGRADQILLWPLGGIAFVEPPSRPGATLWSIAAGPLVNVALSPMLGGLALLISHATSPDLHALLRSVTSRAEVDARSGERPDPDVPERDRKLLILKPQLPLGKAGVVNVERRFTVQDDDEMVAVRGDLVTIPVVGLECMHARGLRGADDGAGVVAGRLLPPDLHFVAAAFLRGSNEDTAVGLGTALEFDRQREVFVALIRSQVSCRIPARRQ
jgi:hypothetical protein